MIRRSIFKNPVFKNVVYSFCIIFAEPTGKNYIDLSRICHKARFSKWNKTFIVNFDSGDILLYHSMNFIPVFSREERYFYSTGQSDIFQTVQPTANSLRKKGSFLSLCCLSVFIFIPLSSYSFTFPRKIVKRKSQHLLRVSRRKKRRAIPFPYELRITI